MSGVERIPVREQRARLAALDGLSRQRALDEAESRQLERLLHADYCRRIYRGAPIPRGVK